MKEKHSLDKILGDFSLEITDDEGAPRKSRGPVTIWLPSEYKARFDRLQLASRRRFGKKVRELILAAIDVAEARAS